MSNKCPDKPVHAEPRIHFTYMPHGLFCQDAVYLLNFRAVIEYFYKTYIMTEKCSNADTCKMRQKINVLINALTCRNRHQTSYS